jgi:hypothetical protein
MRTLKTLRIALTSVHGFHSSPPLPAITALSVANRSLAARFPAIAAQWHPTRNGEVSPEDVVAG